MLNWLTATPNRRRAAAQWQNHEVNQAAEVLEIRVVPAKPSLPPGDYIDPGDGDGAEMKIYPPEKNKQFGEFFVPGLGRFFVKVHPKKNGDALLVAQTDGVAGKIRLTKLGDKHFHVEYKIRGDGIATFEGETSFVGLF